MSKLPTLTKAKICKAALKLYRQGRLLAQHGKAGVYGEASNLKLLRCALSAAFTMTTMKRLGMPKYKNLSLNALVTYPTELRPWMIAIQDAHDEWARGKTDEKPLLALLNEG